MADGKFVKYTQFPGIVSERIITAEDFEANGAPGTPTLVFNSGNRFVIDAEEMGLSDEALKVLKDDGGFTISTSASAPRLAGGTPDPTASPSVPSTKDGNEGSVSGGGGVTGATTAGGSAARR